MPEPPRTRERRGPERRSDIRRSGARLRAVLALEIVVDRESFGDLLDAPPEELVGTWVTENPGYSDRAFVIGYEHIELHLGEDGGIRSHPVLLIRGVQGPESWEYEIDYEGSGGETTLAVHLYPDGVLRLRNPADVVWRRKPSS